MHQGKDKILINFKIFNQHFIYCEQLILSYMQHIPIYLDDLSCEAVIILCHKYMVLYLADLSCEAVIILYHKYKVLYGLLPLYQIYYPAKTTY